jgi:hypothetical protein
MAVNLTIFTENQEWDTFVPYDDAIAAYTVWREALWGDGVEHQIDVIGVDEDGKAQRAIFATESIIGMAVCDARRWKRPSPPAERI